MATITGLTAERMLAIEAASVVDGDVVGDNLILTQHGGTQINAGNVRGPAGPQGPVGQPVSVLAGIPVLEVGLAGQIRAGRQLTAADFTNMGLVVPVGLYNLSDLTDASGNGRNLLNKGAVPTTVGINGLASTAAQFSGTGTQALYVPDTGAADPFRIKTGSIGVWFRCAKRATIQHVLTKGNYAVTSRSYEIYISASNTIGCSLFIDPATTSYGASSIVDVCDNRWHFFVITFDGIRARSYLDGIPQESNPMGGKLNGSVGPFSLGGLAGDSANPNINPFFGRMDEVFVSKDILSEDQIRVLYCAKLPHTLGVAPTRASLNIQRRRRGGSLTAADFPTVPVRLHNFSAGSLGDEGSNGVALINNGGVTDTAGADGTGGNAVLLNTPQSLMATDAGMPAGLTPRSYGCWVRKDSIAVHAFMSWGTAAGGPVVLCDASGNVNSISWGADQIYGKYICDGEWHHLVTVEDNTALDGKRKLYVDGMLNATSDLMGAITLGGANAFRVGATFSDTWHCINTQIDGVFVCNYALTPEQITRLFFKGTQTIAASPKNAGDHLEVLNSTDILATFDRLDGQHLVDLGVLA